MPKYLLELENVDVKYEEVQVLWDINIEVKKGEIVGLIGANGTGKTTTLETIAGLHQPSAGTIQYNGEDITDKEANELVEKGLVLSPERRELFPEMTVKENLLLGGYHLDKEKDLEDILDSLYDLFPRLEERTEQKAGTLSGGERQMLALARSLMVDPQLLLLDEPSLGLQPNLVTSVFERIENIRDDMGTTIFLVEQNALEALEVSERSYIMEKGETTLEDKSDNLIDDSEIKERFLGI